jgi:hypothetical protein
MPNNAEYTGGGSSLAYGEGPAVLGKNQLSYQQPPAFFEGAIDEFTFYERALAPVEIFALYRAGAIGAN